MVVLPHTNHKVRVFRPTQNRFKSKYGYELGYLSNKWESNCGEPGWRLRNPIQKKEKEGQIWLSRRRRKGKKAIIDQVKREI